jgi:outer membrane protein assembly factor BamC
VTPTSFADALARCGLALALLSVLAGCSTVGNLLADDKVDYHTASNRTSGLEVPPDLTQLARDSRYQPTSGIVSASTFRTPSMVAAEAPAQVAPQSIGELHLERQGNDRWLSTSLTPEQLYPQVRAFWKDNGFVLVQDRPEAGVLETDWAENRAKLPKDVIRNTLGKVFDSAYSTGELDKFRTRIERTPTGSDIYITHRGMAEVYVGERKESTTWQPKPADPQLEAEFLSRLMVKLGAPEQVAKNAVATTPSGPAHARVIDGQPAASLQVDDDFDRAWRRVGLALDRSGFTVVDRDRGQGLYFVRYVDPKFAGKQEPGFFARLFGAKKDDANGPARYRVAVKGDGGRSIVSVHDAQGAPENGDTGKRIIALLVDDLK